MRKPSKSLLTPSDRLSEVLAMISSGVISYSDPATLRLCDHEVVVRKNNKLGYEILTIPESLRDKSYIKILLDCFTTDYFLQQNSSTSSQYQFLYTAKDFIEFAESQVQNNLAAADYPTAYYRQLIKTHTLKRIEHKMRMLNVIYRTATESKYGKISSIPHEIQKFLSSLQSIKPASSASKKRPPLGRYLSIPSAKFTNRELLFGLRLGSIWLLNKINNIRESLTQIDSIKSAIESVSGLAEPAIRRKLAGAPETVQKCPNLQKACLDQWQATLRDPLLAEWQFYDIKKFSLRGLDYSRRNISKPYTQENHSALLSRYIDPSTEKLRVSTKGYGRNDKEWDVFKPEFKSARDLARKQCVMWGLDWVRHMPIEKLLFVWLLSSERIQPAGIECLKTTSLSVNLDNPKTLQITSIKLRRSRGKTVKEAEVKSPIYRKSNPPFKTYLNWLITNISASHLIADYNPSSHLILNSSAALHGNFRVNQEMDTYPLFRILITPNTIWNTSFLRENEENPREARAFIEILRSRIIPETNEDILLKLPPDPINQSAVLFKELESNLTEEYSELNSQTFGHSTSTGRSVYKDGFLTSGIEELSSIVDDFIRHLGNEKYKEAQLLSEHLRDSTRKVSLEELKELCNVPDSSTNINQLIKHLDSQDKLMLNGLIENGADKYIIETDLTAAIMSSYLDHLETYLPTISLSERSFKAINIVAEYIHLSQLLSGFSEHIKKSGMLLKERLNIHFPPVN